MHDEMTVEFGESSIETMEKLKEVFGVSDRLEALRKALQLADALKKYVHDGVVTVVDPWEDDVPNEGGRKKEWWDGALVDIVLNRRLDRPRA